MNICCTFEQVSIFHAAGEIWHIMDGLYFQDDDGFCWDFDVDDEEHWRLLAGVVGQRHTETFAIWHSANDSEIEEPDDS